MTALDAVTWPDLDPARPYLLVVPLGSCEQHGPHLPFDVDTAVAAHVATALAQDDDVVVAPPLAYGASGEHEGFPGTLSIGTAALQLLLVELARSASRWASRVMFVSGHGGNRDALVAATTLLRREGHDVAWWPCAVPSGDAHAGRTETSLLLALRPEAVRTDRAEAGSVLPLPDLLPRLRTEGVRAVSANGVLGDPTGASADEGRALLTDLGRRLQRDVAAWSVRDDGRLAVPDRVTQLTATRS